MGSLHRPLRAHLTTKDVIIAALICASMLACLAGPPPPGGSSDGGPDGLDAGTSAIDGGVCNQAMRGGTVTGILATGVHDISYEGGAANIRLTHKRDVDPIEDGCISAANVSLYTASGACTLNLNFAAIAGEPTMVLKFASLNIDSQCPGWLDAEEGNFKAAAVDAGRLTVTAHAPTNIPFGCFAASLKPSGVVELTAAGRPPLTVDLAVLNISGTAYSNAITPAICPTP